MATLITKKQTSFMLSEIFPDGGRCYEQEVEAFMPRPIKSLFLTKELAEEMGNPERIALTLEPVKETT